MSDPRIKLRVCTKCRSAFATNGKGRPRCEGCKPIVHRPQWCRSCGKPLHGIKQLCRVCRPKSRRHRRVLEALRILEKRQQAEYLAAERQRNRDRMRRVRAEARA